MCFVVKFDKVEWSCCGKLGWSQCCLRMRFRLHVVKSSFVPTLTTLYNSVKRCEVLLGHTSCESRYLVEWKRKNKVGHNSYGRKFKFVWKVWLVIKLFVAQLCVTVLHTGNKKQSCKFFWPLQITSNAFDVAIFVGDGNIGESCLELRCVVLSMISVFWWAMLLVDFSQLCITLFNTTISHTKLYKVMSVVCTLITCLIKKLLFLLRSVCFWLFLS